MRVYDRNWMQLETLLKSEDRIVLPLGSVEQHGFLSLGTDAILAERVAVEAAEPLGVPVLPALPFGLTPSFQAFPGSLTLRFATYLEVLRDLLDSLEAQGFRRILIVNGHGGNAPAAGLIAEWRIQHPETQVLWHNWWNAPKTWAKVIDIDPVASHASWMENFPWTRVPGVELPSAPKAPLDPKARLLDPWRFREALGDGNYGGRYARSDEEMLAIWRVAVDETRELLERGWA